MGLRLKYEIFEDICRKTSEIVLFDELMDSCTCEVRKEVIYPLSQFESFPIVYNPLVNRHKSLIFNLRRELRWKWQTRTVEIDTKFNE